MELCFRNLPKVPHPLREGLDLPKSRKAACVNLCDVLQQLFPFIILFFLVMGFIFLGTLQGPYSSFTGIPLSEGPLTDRGKNKQKKVDRVFANNSLMVTVSQRDSNIPVP